MSKNVGQVLTQNACPGCNLAGADLRDTDMTNIGSDEELDVMELTGVRLNGARFKDGITCGGFPRQGGWGCEIAH